MKYFRNLRAIQVICMILVIILGLGLLALLFDGELDLETFWGVIFGTTILLSMSYLAGVLKKFIKFTLGKIDPDKLKASEDKEDF